MNHYIILGGGIGGLSLAIAMQRRGHKVTVYEAAPAFKPLGAGLALASNAMRAYREIGIDQQVVPAGKQIKRMFVKDYKGGTISQTNAEELTRRFGVVGNFTIHRADLHDVLSSQLSHGSLLFGKAATDFEQAANGITLRFADGSSVNGDYLIACDGIHSVVRKKLLPGSLPRYAGYTCWRAIVEDLPEGFNPDETTESWGPGKRFGVVPLSGNRVYWFATLNAKANDPAMKAYTSRELQNCFKHFHFPIPQILQRTRDEQLIWSDIIDLAPIPRFAFDRVLLMGDAAHATTPNMGQGACMAIEDAATLANALSKYTPADAFSRFEAHRIARTKSIVEQSWNIGKLAQLENRVLMRIRNSMLRLVPQRTIDKQIKFLYDVSFQP